MREASVSYDESDKRFDVGFQNNPLCLLSQFRVETDLSNVVVKTKIIR